MANDLQVGFEQDGYRYLGGDPADQRSWESTRIKSGTIDGGYRYIGGDPSNQSNWEDLREPGLIDRVKEGVKNTTSFLKASATDDPEELAKIVAERQRTQLPATEAGARIAGDLRRSADEMKAADADIERTAAAGDLFGTTRNVLNSMGLGVAATGAKSLASNPKETLGMIAENLPNSAPGLAGGLAGAALGAATPIPGGAIVGGVLGGTAGGYNVEMGGALYDQILKEAKARGIDTADAKALAPLIAEKQAEFTENARLKGIGTAGTDAVLNAATFGLAGAGERALVRSANQLGKRVADGSVDAATGAAELAALEAKNAARNTLGAKLARGTAVTAGEMSGEAASEYAGQKLAYGEADATDVVLEGLLGAGQGVGMAAGRGLVNKVGEASGLENYTDVDKALALSSSVIEASKQREAGLGDIMNAPSLDAAVDAAARASDLDLQTSLVPELASDINAYQAASLRAPALNPSDAVELAAAKGAMDRVGSLDLSQPASIAAPASAVTEAGDSAAREVEAAGGVATPAQAAILDRAFPGQKMYDQVVGSSEQVPTVSNNSPIIIEPGRAPRETVSFANPLEAANAEGWKRFAANQKQAAQTVANEATSVGNQAPQVNVNNVISALQTTPGLQTAEQRVTLNAARQNLSADDFQLLETAAQGRFNLSAEQKIRLNTLENQSVFPQTQETFGAQENQATLSAARTDEQEAQLPQAELIYSPEPMGEGYRLIGTRTVNGRQMYVYADRSVTPSVTPAAVARNETTVANSETVVPEMGMNVPEMGTTVPNNGATEEKPTVQILRPASADFVGGETVGSVSKLMQDGVEHEYTVVQSGRMPGVSSVVRQLLRPFNLDVSFFTSDTLKADGFIRNDNGRRTLYVNANSRMNPIAVAFHEMFHMMRRDNPVAYQAVMNVVRRNLQGDTGNRFRNYYDGMEAGPNPNFDLTEAELEEIAADLVGNSGTTPAFLSDVFKEISNIAPQGQARSIILRLAATIEKVVKAALEVIRKAGFQTSFDTDAMVNNLEEIRAVIKQALVDYAVQQKESQAKIAMEFTRETNRIQLSPSRENTTVTENDLQLARGTMVPGATLQTQGAENAAENDTGRIRGVQQNPGENRPGSVGYGRDQNDQIPSFGTDGGRAGSIRVQGVHYSKGQLSHVDGNFYGSNVSRHNGAEAERVRLARDRRITKRGYFYINTGNGIKPEANVGSVPHTAYLNNLYDTATGLITAADENSFESAVLDAGFDGFINRSAGMAVVLDNKQVPVVPSDGTAEVVQAADKTTSVRAELSSIKSLPSGELTRERWGQVLKAARPDLHEKIEPTGAFNGDERVYKDGLVKFSPPREYKMDLAKEDRAISKAAGLTQEETAMVKTEAKKLGLTNVRTEELLTAARETKKQYPQSAGWAPIKLVGLKASTNEDTGETTVDLKWQEDAYAFNRAPGVNRAPPKMDRAWADKVAKSFHGLIKDIFDRAAAGDKNAQIIISHQTWYRNVAEVLRREYGGFGDLLADLLGATSPNTPVDTNWKFSIDAMRRFVRGDFNAELERFDQFVKDGGRVSDFPSADKIRQASGKLYGMNSDKAMKAMLDMWRILEKGSAPKARNFALNLIGQSNMATIDVWAARMIRRAANLVRGAKYPRIPPPAEKGVTGEWNASTTGVTGEFGFGAYVMDLVSEMLAKEGINVTPPDLQAIAWFAEKELWGTNRWTTVTGEGGSFEENIDAMPVERFMAGWSIQQGEKVPDEGDASIVQVRVGSVLSGDESVVAFRVMPSHGLYGNTVEQSFDTEWTVLKGEHDPSLVMAEIARIARDYDQFDIFVSRVIAADENNPNARPGVEVYFKNKRALDQAMPILERFTAKGQDGFTMVVDPRSKTPGEYIGVRLQYVPEISMRWDEELRKTLLEPGGIEAEIAAKTKALDMIVAELSDVDGVAYAKVFKYDTVVVGKENYDGYIDRGVAGPNSGAGSEVWFGQPIREGLERAVARYERNDGQVGSGGVSDVGVSEVRDSAQEVKLSPPRFYSQLERTIEQVPPRLTTQPAAQWKAWLASNSAKFGIKKDEIEWSGINNYLDLRGKDKVTAAEIGQFLNLNNVKITEVVKGEPEGAFLRMPGGAEYGDSSGAKYGQYVLPGGSNYREMLLTLPTTEDLETREQFTIYDENGEAITQGSWPPSSRTQERLAANPQWRVERKSVIERGGAKRKGVYLSSHWDEANILAHIRLNDRTDANGDKVLFVEEIQSDWAQAGRKGGIRGELSQEAKARVEELRNQRIELDRQWRESDNPVERRSLMERANEISNKVEEIEGPVRGAVPAAPFISNTKDWLALAVKRVMLLAAQGDYDKVAFVNGQQSADRYNLAKQIDYIEYEKTDTNEWFIKAMDHTGRSAVTEYGQTPEKLESLVGKEIAQKIVNNEGTREPGEPATYGVLRNTQLSVGGEGMKSFYDRIVPQVVNDVLKKLGGRTEMVSLEFDPNPELDQWVPEDGDGDGSKAPVEQGLQAGFTVTPEMREKLQGDGLPLFSRQRNSAESVYYEDGIPNEQQVNRAIDPARLAQLRRAAASIEAPERGITFFIEDNGTAVLRGPANTKVPRRFQRFAENNGLALSVRRNHGGKGQTLSMPMVYRESGAMYFGESFDEDQQPGFDTFVNRNGKTRFSPSRQSVADAIAGHQFKQEIVNQAKFKLADIIAPGNGFNWFHKTVGTQFHKAKVNPLFKKVFDLGQQFLDDVTLFATRAEDKAADLFPRFGLSKSMLKTGLSKTDNQLIARALTDGTLENGPNPHDGVVWTDDQLRTKYGMNDTQIGYYRQARAALDQSLDDLAKSEMATHMRIAMKANITPLIRADISLGDVRDMLIQSLDAGIASTTNEDAAKMLQKTKSQINGIYSTTTNLKNHGYAPLMRFGNHTVTGYDENDNVVFFQMTDTRSEASLMAKNLEGQFAKVQVGKKSEESYKMFKGVTPDTLELFAKYAAIPNDTMTQAYLQLAVSTRSAMKRLINRKGTSGYSLDATRTLATFLTSNARKSSSALNMYDMKQASLDIPESDSAKDEAIKLVDYLQNPGEEAAKLRGFLFFQYLGGSIASGIVNLTQPILQTYPYLSQFGAGQAASAMKTGTVAATHFLRGKRVGDPNLQAALEKAKAEGLIDPQEIYQLMAASQSGSGSFLSYKLMRLWGINFGVTEIMNRTVTFAAAFKVGQSLSKEELAKAGAKDAYSFAQGAIYETQGLYNKGNRPDWARGAVGGTIFTFKQYSISYLEFMTRLYKNDKKAFGIALAILIMASGLQGLPGADDLDDVIDTAGNWMGYATNTKKWKREFLEDVFGKEMAAFALHGVSTIPGMPIDVQARLGLGNIIPGTGLMNPTKKDKGREVAEVFGVAGGLAMSTMDTTEALARGDVRRAALSILPGAVRNLIQAGEMASTGEYRDTRGRLVQKVDGGDVIAKAIGFQPAEIAAGNRRMREVQADIDIVKTKQEEVNGKYARAIVDKDQAAMAEVRAEIRDWNQKNPDLRIKFNMSAIQQRVKQARLTKEARFIKSAPQQIRQQVREAVLAD